MSFRFRKSVRVFPGLRLNFSTGGISVSAGAPGATFNFGPRGSSLTVGILGTGLSYRHSFRPPLRRVERDAERGPTELSPSVSPNADQPLPGEIRSADVAQLTSPDLQGFKTLVNEAARQKAELEPDYQSALRSRERAWRKLRRREQPPLRWLLKDAIPKARAAFDDADHEAAKVLSALVGSEIRIEIVLSPESGRAWSEVEAAHAALARVERVWDVTSSMLVDRARQRSAASFEVKRKPVRLQPIADSIIVGSPGLRFENANGDDLDLFGGFVLVRSKGSSDYALVDLRDLDVAGGSTRFIEDEGVPSDAETVGYAWAKSNRDGSPDRRFRDNRQIPIALYGEIEFRSPTGLREAYLVSNAAASSRFVSAVETFKRALRQQAAGAESDSRETAPIATAASSPRDLPALPSVAGAYELLLLPAALIAAPIALASWRNTPPLNAPQELSSSLPNTVTQPPRSSVSVPEPVRHEPAPEPTLPPPPPPTPTTSPASTPSAFPQRSPDPVSPPARERLALVQTANVRSEPDRASRSLRVVDKGTTVAVFKRQGSWIEVGDAEAWGWVHGSLLKKP